MGNRRRHRIPLPWYFGALTLGVAALGVAFLLLRPAPTSPAPAGASSSALDSRPQDYDWTPGRVASPEPRAALLRYDLRPGDQLTYGFDVEQTVRLRLSSPEASTEGTLRMSGSLVWRVYDRAQDGMVLVGVTPSRVRLDVVQDGTAVDPASASEPARALERESFVRMSPRGELIDLLFPADMEDRESNLFKTLVLEMQVILPDTPSSTWEVEEEDATGRFLADYEGEAPRPEDGAPVCRIRKRKLAYLEVFAYGGTGGEAPVLGVVPEGSAEALFDAGRGHVRVLHGSETLSVAAGELLQEVRTHVEFRYRLSERGLLEGPLPERAELDRRLAVCRLSVPGGMEGVPEAMAREQEEEWARLASGHAVSEILEQLDRMAREGTLDGRDAYEALRVLAALVRQDDGNVEELLEAIRFGRVSLELAPHLPAALVAAGTHAAQRGLCRLAEDEGVPEAVGYNSLIGLARVEDPMPEAENTIRRAAAGPQGEWRTSAGLLGAGILASRLSRGNPQRSSELVTFLQERESRLGSSQDVIPWLEALGNTGSESCLPKLQRYITHEGEAIREAAVVALRRMLPERVRGILLERLDEDRSPLVRAAAIDALAGQAVVDVRDAVCRRLQDPSEAPEVRRAAASYCIRWRQIESCRQILQRVARGDPDEELRRAAAEALEE